MSHWLWQSWAALSLQNQFQWISPQKPHWFFCLHNLSILVCLLWLKEQTMAGFAHRGGPLKQISLNETLSWISKLLYLWEKKKKKQIPATTTIVIVTWVFKSRKFSTVPANNIFGVEWALLKCGQRLGFSELASHLNWCIKGCIWCWAKGGGLGLPGLRVTVQGLRCPILSHQT